jgi:Protein of unknown function (DUF3592)
MPFAMRVVFALFGVAAIAVSLWLRRMSIRARSWPSTSAKIIRSALVSDPHDSGSSVEISYQFSVEGRHFDSRCISFSPLPSSPQSQAQLVARFPVGTLVDAYFDPKNPDRSVLLRDESNTWLWGPLVGAVFIAIATLAA